MQANGVGPEQQSFSWRVALPLDGVDGAELMARLRRGNVGVRVSDTLAMAALDEAGLVVPAGARAALLELEVGQRAGEQLGEHTLWLDVGELLPLALAGPAAGAELALAPIGPVPDPSSVGTGAPALRLGRPQRVEAASSERAALAPLGRSSATSAAALDAGRDATWLPTLLDSTQGQREVIVRALAGESQVIDAPVGAGKTQTASNLAACAAASGRACVVVAPPETLRVIATRLASAGVGDAVANFASDVGGGGGLVTDLARSLERRARGLTAPVMVDAPAEVTRALDATVAALHAPRALGHSVHSALLRLIDLQAAPRVMAPAAAAVTDLTAGRLAEQRQALTKFAARLVAVGALDAHPWRASSLVGWQLSTEDAVAIALAELVEAAQDATRRLRDAAERVPGLLGRTRTQLGKLAALATLAASSPRPGAELVEAVARATDDDLRGLLGGEAERRVGAAIDAPRGSLEYLALARRRQAAAHTLALRWNPRLWSLDVPGLAERTREASRRSGPTRWLALRAVRAALGPAFRGDDLPGDAELLRDLELADEVRRIDAVLGEARDAARRWLGELAAVDPAALDSARIEQALGWATRLRAAFAALEFDGDFGAGWRALVAEVSVELDGAERAPAGGVFGPLAEALARFAICKRALEDVAGVSLDDVASADGGHLGGVIDVAQAWGGHAPALRDWALYHEARAAAVAIGLEEVVATCERGRLAPEHAVAAWERATMLAWVDGVIAADPALQAFWGADEQARIDALEVVEQTLRNRLRADLLATSVGGNLDEFATATLADEIAALGQLAREQRQGATSPLALQVVARLPRLLTRLRPIVLASPAAAEALAHHVSFDLVVFDDVPGEEGLARIAAGSPVVTLRDAAATTSDAWAPVFGRPTVARVLIGGGVDGPHWPHVARELPTARSIEVEHVEGGDDAARRTARIRAAVAETIAHLGDPARRGRSLALAARGASWCRELEVALAQALRARPDLALFRSASAVEPVVVVDLTRPRWHVRDMWIVCSERDVESDVRTCEAYARERVLVVGVAVPAERAAVVAPQAAPGALVRELASLLSSRGVPAVDAAGAGAGVSLGAGLGAAELLVLSSDEPPRPLLVIDTDAVDDGERGPARDRLRLRQAVLASMGVHLHRVWTLDWLTDHAREVERLWEAVATAEQRARAHRRATGAWSVNQLAAHEASALRGAHGASVSQPMIAGRTRPSTRAPQALGAPRAAAGSAPVAAAGSAPAQVAPLTSGQAPMLAPMPVPVLVGAERDATERQVAAGSGGTSRATLPTVGRYVAATTPVGRRSADDLFSPRHRDEATKLIERIVAAEAPIHLGLLARRVGAYFGIGRVTARVAEQVRALATPVTQVGTEPDVFWRLDQAPGEWPQVRVAGDAVESRRVIDDVPLAELASAVLVVLHRSGGGLEAEVARDAARLLGFSRVTDRVIERIGVGVDMLARADVARRDGQRVLRGG